MKIQGFCRIPMDLALDINILENFHPAKIPEQQQRSLELLLQTRAQRDRFLSKYHSRGIHTTLIHI